MNKKIVLSLFILFIFMENAAYAANARVGTTFSQVQCEYLSLNWQEAYKEVLAMNFDIIRLGAYWSRIEKSKGEFDFSDLDWQIQKARENKIPILLTVGMKAPRWPEYFIPSWLRPARDFHFGSAVSDVPHVKECTLLFISKVVGRYKNEDIIVAWQVENEPLSRSGPRELWIRKDFLQKEISLVKELDGRNRPIIVNAMTYPNGFLRFLTRMAYKKNPIDETIDIAQIPALNVYFAIGQKLLSKNICFWTNPKGRISYLSQFVARAASQNKLIWVTELQAEPWEPAELVHTREKDAITCGADNFHVAFEELRSLNIDTIFLWGVEYWIYRKQQYKDNKWIEAFDQIANKN